MAVCNGEKAENAVGERAIGRKKGHRGYGIVECKNKKESTFIISRLQFITWPDQLTRHGPPYLSVLSLHYKYTYIGCESN
jgi:hypothetical protein